MVNKSRGDMAYTLVDVDSAVSRRGAGGHRAIEGVLSVRYLPALSAQGTPVSLVRYLRLLVLAAAPPSFSASDMPMSTPLTNAE